MMRKMKTLRQLRKKKKAKNSLFSGVGHGIRKPKPKKVPPTTEKSPKNKCTPEIHQEKFYFPLTPRELFKRKRVPLNEENSQKRKFFKSTVNVTSDVEKLQKLKENVSDEFNDNDDLDQDATHKRINSLLQAWDIESEASGVTRQKASEFESPSTKSRYSYITPISKTNLLTRQKASEFELPSTESRYSYITPISKTNLLSNNVQKKSEMSNTLSSSSISTNNVCDENSPQVSNVESKQAKQLYPVFVKPQKEILTNANKKDKSKVLLEKAAAPLDQYQIDAGQCQVGPVECSTCGMVYDVGDSTDEKRHTEYHEQKFNVKYKVCKTDKIVGLCGTDQIVMINYSDEKKRNKVEDILKITETEIGSGYSFGIFSIAFVYIRDEVIIGCLIAEPKVNASRRFDSNGIVLLSDNIKIAKCGINRIWVHKKFRGHKIATELMNCLRKNFSYGEYLQIEELAFSVTTADGHLFAKRYTEREDYLTYSGLKF